MTKSREIFKCDICGVICEILNPGGGTLSCCGAPMRLVKENNQEASVEKHIPVLTRNGDEVTAVVGETLHPMINEHFVEWIEVLTENKIYRHHLKPGEEPKATFLIKEEILYSRAYCNIHGLWADKK